MKPFFEWYLNESKNKNLWFHSTNKKNLNSIKFNGLIINPSETGFTLNGSWAKEIYGVTPIYFSKIPEKYSDKNTIVLKIDLTGIDKYADLPGLVDHGMIVYEDGYDNVPFQDDDSGTWEDFILDGRPGDKTAEAIQLTKTCCVLQNIDKNRIMI